MISIALRLFLHLSAVVVLARILTPEDYGLVAMATTLVSLLYIVSDWGLTMASTQTQQINDQQLSALFWINTLGGIVLAVIALCLSPVLVLIFREPQLVGITVALSAKLIAVGVGAQHEAIVRRRMQYGYLYGIGVISQAIGLATAFACAFAGFGFWSLVVLQVGIQVTRTTLLWWKTRWKPLAFRWTNKVGPVVAYGFRIAPASLLFHLSETLGGVVIGMTFGSGSLGLLHRGRAIVMMPIENLRAALTRLVPSSLSRLQHNEGEFLRFYTNALAVFCFLGCWILGFVFADSSAVITLALGEQWLSAIPLVRWLVLAGLAATMGVATNWMLMPLAETKKLLALRVVRLCMVSVGVICGVRWGTVGVVAGYSIATSVAVLVELIVSVIFKGVRVRRIYGALGRPILSALVGASLILLMPSGQSVVRTVLNIILYSCVFLSVNMGLPGGSAVIRSVLRSVVR